MKRITLNGKTVHFQHPACACRTLCGNLITGHVETNKQANCTECVRTFVMVKRTPWHQRDENGRPVARSVVDLGTYAAVRNTAKEER